MDNDSDVFSRILAILRSKGLVVALLVLVLAGIASRAYMGAVDAKTDIDSIMNTVMVVIVLLGLVGEYVGRVFLCINATPQYVEREYIPAEREKE